MSSPIILSLASMPVSFMGSPDFLCSPPKKKAKVPVSIQRYAHQMKVFHGLQEPCFTILFS